MDPQSESRAVASATSQFDVLDEDAVGRTHSVLAFLAVRRRSRAANFAFALGTVLWGSIAMAQPVAPADDLGRAHFEIAQSYYAAGRFVEAAHEFELAYEAAPRAELLFNIYLSYRDANDVDRALASLESYFAADPTAETPMLHARLVAMREEVTRRAAAAAEQPQSAPSEPEEASASRSSTEEIAAPAEPDRGSDTDVAASEARGARRLGIALIASGASVALIGFTSAAIALGSKQAALDANCGPSATPPLPRGQCYDVSAVRDVERTTGMLRGIAYGSLAVGAGLATAGIVRWIRHGRAPEDDTPSVGLACDGRGCAASLGVVF